MERFYYFLFQVEYPLVVCPECLEVEMLLISEIFFLTLENLHKVYHLDSHNLEI